MKKNIFNKVIVVGLVLCMFLSVLPKAFAQTQTPNAILIAQLQLLLEDLFKKLNLLIEQNNNIDQTVTVGTTVVTIGSTRVRETPGLNRAFLDGSHAAGDVGTIISEPKIIDGLTWFFIDYNIGTDGWVESSLINKHTTKIVPATSINPSTCTLTTDKKIYTIGEDVTFTWNAPGAKFVLFSSNKSGKDGLQLPEGIFEKTIGTTRVEANFIGTDIITLEVHNEYGTEPVTTCNTTVNVDEIKRSFGSRDIKSVVKEIQDPIIGSLGDEYETYTIILKTGDSFTMAIFQEQYADRGSIFAANGYTGSLNAILELVQ